MNLSKLYSNLFLGCTPDIGENILRRCSKQTLAKITQMCPSWHQMCERHILLSVQETNVYIPRQFLDGRKITKVIIISDVDGVARENVAETIDERIIQAGKRLLLKGAHLTYISGSPILSESTTGNMCLGKAFGTSLATEIAEGAVDIVGVLGAQRMNPDGSTQIVDQFSPRQTYEITGLIIQAFLQEVLHHGNPKVQRIATALQEDIIRLRREERFKEGNLRDFDPIVLAIRENIDGEFRQGNTGALLTYNSSYPAWSSQDSSQWLKKELDTPGYEISALPPEQRMVATGLKKMGEKKLNYVLVSKTNKGPTTKRVVDEQLARFPESLILTFGDEEVDLPMHAYAHIAFHVGLESVLKSSSSRHYVTVRDQDGRDNQHVLGTLKILELVEAAIGTSFLDLKYIPKKDFPGHLCSIKEIFHDIS